MIGIQIPKNLFSTIALQDVTSTLNYISFGKAPSAASSMTVSFLAFSIILSLVTIC